MEKKFVMPVIVNTMSQHVRLRGSKSRCSGVLLSPTLVMTARHFVRDNNDCMLSGRVDDGSLWRRYADKAVIHHLTTDIALIHLTAPVFGVTFNWRLATMSLLPGMKMRTIGWAGKPLTGRYIVYAPWFIGSNRKTIVRAAGVIYNRPVANYGDSGGPVLVGNNIVGIQSMIIDPGKINTGLAVVALTKAHQQELQWWADNY
ncbi:trypsin-like serine protease [Corynebacterium kutscheri]|uniref:trypsin-like serine protease n=1 Tax=Corynebacterium kutscheri TaxID=35755 RepID=UPI000F822FF7|nr:trypsin-like serine protease [Corynebacterium kutscheri]